MSGLVVAALSIVAGVAISFLWPVGGIIVIVVGGATGIFALWVNLS